MLGSLRRACSAFVEHYHVERLYQALDNERIEVSESRTGDVQCSERLGEILKHHEWAA